MAALPVIDSTISPEALSEWLGEAYPFSQAPEVKLFRTGINHSYFVTAGAEKSVLRIYSYQWRTETQIREEIRVLQMADRAGVPVSLPMPDKDGNYLQTLEAPEGQRFAMLFTFAEGKKVRHFSERLCERLGETMGRWHAATEGEEVQRITYTARTLAQDPYTYAGRFFRAENNEMQFIRRSGDKISELFGQADQAKLRSGIVHLDIWYDNMNITPEETFTFFDFDFCGNGWLLHDVAYFLTQMYFQEADKQVYEGKKAAFLRGYTRTNSLSDEEIALLPWSSLSIWIFYLGVQSRRFDNWSNVFLSENYLIRFMGMIKDYLKYNGIEWE
ncbi:phosphotransferase [Roseivirga sp. BDSF3-8]|uniref:phosphotransferase n=1 Tax=Roseivirga sp. BDSF3-8 TaxID=3241598 RepID=UPI0035322F20